MADEAAGSVILGSASPRRAELLASLGVAFSVEPVDLDEQAVGGARDSAPLTAQRIAEAKFAAVRARPHDRRVLLTADTLVGCDGVAMGKPSDRDELADVLAAMSGRRLDISTAVCAGRPGRPPRTLVVRTLVALRHLGEAEIARYVASGAGDDKAGGLALQAEAASFVASTQGCWSNVVGLPLCAVASLLDLPPPGASRRDRCGSDLCGGPPGR